MKLSRDLTLRFLSEDPEKGSQSEVLLAGRATGTVLNGHVLEAALECRKGWLLFVTGDVPQEEFLEIYLLNHEGLLLDAASIGWIYSTGAFSDLTLHSGGTVHFRFIDEADWSVIVLEKPRWGVPWWPDARGVWRGRRLRRSFDIHRLKVGAGAVPLLQDG